DAVKPLEPLLFTQADAVFAQFRSAVAVHARQQALPPLDRALRGVAAGPLEVQLHALAATELADRVECSSHCFRLFLIVVPVDHTRRFFGGRQPLCGSGVTSSIALT